MEPPKEEWESIVDELIAAPRWIMDGNYSGTMERRIAASEAVLFLDLPRRVCIWRVLKRWALHWNERRPDMAEGCRERWDGKFLLWVWNYPNRSRPRVRQLIEERPESVRALILRSQTEIDILLKSQQENPSPKSMRQTVGGKQ